MPPVSTSVQESEIHQFFHAVVCAVVRAEAQHRMPARFMGIGTEIWSTFRNELTLADLVAIAVQDAGVNMPIPFDPRYWWQGWPDWVLFQQSEDDAEHWIRDALESVDEPRDAYLRDQAGFLGVDLPTDSVLSALPTPEAHERWLELPGTGGWLAYTLCQRLDSTLYLWGNFTVVCGTPQEMLLAGLVAWELNAPPRMRLPMRLDSSGLLETLKAGETYDGVMGRRDLHAHRDLRVLHRDGKEPLWI